MNRAGWLLVAIGAVAALLIAAVLPQAPAPVVAAEPVEHAPSMEVLPAFPTDRFNPPDHPEWPGHWARRPSAWEALGVSIDSEGALEQARAAIAEMPAALRQVIVLRDIEGRAPVEVREALGLDPERGSIKLGVWCVPLWSASSRVV